ncbi:MAG TPA: xanthine dehydrogenase family protein molybdopterin-binding subunit, partial [Geminicoccaceae bacterium]|nr:xanthine dehydrogenase family protein molybdopterin-binding subunit [Geminicoccaceae bacterium]
FGIGQPVHRKEDPRLLRGEGRYTDDVDLPGQAFARVVRSPHAHGRLQGIKVSAAMDVPGVLAVYTATDFARAGYGEMLCKLPLKNADGSPLFAPPRPIFVTDRVRYVGEPIAMVVAENAHAAQDAAELIVADIEPMPAMVDPEAALEVDALRVHDGHPNLCLDWRFGDHEAAERAFAAAAAVARVRVVSNRVVVAAMEPRAAVAGYDAATGRFTLHVGCQGVFGLRRSLAEDLLRIEPERLRVLSHDVGGSFGMKAAAYPEYVGILHAARALGRPVKWCDERSGSFLSDQHGRGTIVEGELALDEAGNFLAVRARNLADMGAYLTAVGPMMPAINMQKNLPSLYRTPIVAIATRCVFTNTVPVGPYRGAGRPEANYVMERLIDAAARASGRDPAALRRQNLIPRDSIPYRAPSGLEYDSGDFAAVLDAGLEKADWDGFTRRRHASEASGKLRGRGLACYLEVTAPPNPEMGGIRFEPDGRVTMITGTLDYGQGHAAAFAQVLVDRLGLPFELIDLVQGDSDELLAGGGTGGSRSIMASGKALVEAAAEVIEKGRALAGHFLEAAPADIAFAAGEFRIAGTDRAIALLDLAARVRGATDLPADLPGSLDAALVSESPPSAFPNGCHVAEVEVDPETGEVRLDRYTA